MHVLMFMCVCTLFTIKIFLITVLTLECSSADLLSSPTISMKSAMSTQGGLMGTVQGFCTTKKTSEALRCGEIESISVSAYS